MGFGPGQLKRVIALGLMGLAVIVGVVFAFRPNEPSWMNPVPGPIAVEQRTPGGSVRVVVSTPPELSDVGEGGRTLRSLVWPRLFEPQPDGTWRSSLVEAGTDHTTKDGRVASFKLRPAKWSDGSLITVEDLRRTADDRFVDRIDGPDSSGVIRVHLKQKLPGWRMLWSDGGIEPQQSSVSGGPFVVSELVSGQQTVLRRNDKWFGQHAFLDEVRLQYVPDYITARQLLERGEVEIAAPRADTVRTSRYGSIEGVRTASREESGTWVGLWFNTTAVSEKTILTAFSKFPREKFVGALLADEAIESEMAQPNASHPQQDMQLTLTSPVEIPLVSAFEKSLSRSLEPNGVVLKTKVTDTSGLEADVARGAYEAALRTTFDGPVACMSCLYGSHQGDIADLAKRADSGDKSAVVQLKRRLLDRGVVLPLWREKPFVAYRENAVQGISPNGFTGSIMWNAYSWWRP